MKEKLQTILAELKALNFLGTPNNGRITELSVSSDKGTTMKGVAWNTLYIHLVHRKNSV
jgi:hypothetical protein